MVLEKERKKKGEERKKWGGGENEHQSNFSKTEQQNFTYKNILRDFDTWEPYATYTLTTYYLVLSQIYNR